MRKHRALRFSTVILGCALLCWCRITAAADVPALDENGGPFMVLARAFRGPEAETFARAVASELRKEHGLTASLYVVPGRNGLPEAAVLVGDCKTPQDARALVHRIRKIKPACLANLPESRGGLTRALQTTNPLVSFDFAGQPSRK
jgi:hypothetical protein